MTESNPTLTDAQVRALFEARADLRRPEFSPYRKGGGSPWGPSYSAEMRTVMDAMEPLMIQFSWPDWQEEAVKYVRSAELMAAADLETVRRLVTTHMRKERFCQGHVGSTFESGHLMALLDRAAELLG